jgi:hypothetical protein
LLNCRCSARHCRHPPVHPEYTSTLRGVHAIWAAPRRRQPNISGDDHECRVIAGASKTAGSSVL